MRNVAETLKDVEIFSPSSTGYVYYFDPASARPVGLGPGREEVEQVDGETADHVEAVAHERGPRPHLQEVEPILRLPAGRSHTLPQTMSSTLFQYTLCGKGVKL